MAAKQAELWAPSPGKSGPICFPGLNISTHPREMCFVRVSYLQLTKKIFKTTEPNNLMFRWFQAITYVKFCGLSNVLEN